MLPTDETVTPLIRMTQKQNIHFLRIIGAAMIAISAAAAGDSALQITPSEFQLLGPRSSQRMIVTQSPNSEAVRDISFEAKLTTADPAIAAIQNGVIVPVGNGSTEIHASADGQTVTAKVTVAGLEDSSPVAFRTEVLAALTKAGCNMGACHGAPSGKGGFRLSLRGYDPELDLLTLRGEFFNRRSNILAPERKPSAEKAVDGSCSWRWSTPAEW